MKKKDVIDHFKSVNATARALDITHAAVSRWGDDVPLGRAYQIEVVTSGKLKVNEKLYKKEARK